MTRVLFIARYRDATMHRKVELLAHRPDLSLCYIYPRFWQDELVRVEQSIFFQDVHQVAVSMVGRPGDPHRALYETGTFEMQRFRPDIVHAEEEPDSLAALQIAFARRLLAPQAKLLIYTWQNIDRPKRWYVRTVIRATLDASDCVMCANYEAADILERQGYRKPTPILPAIGVDTRTFVPGPTKANEHSLTIGYLGRLVPEKGVDVLIEAVRRVAHSKEPAPGIRLLIIGDGPHRPALEAQAASLGDHVQFMPPVPPSQVAQAMHRLDALILPSRTTPVWKEQFGRVLVEAMACRVPVIGSDSGAIPEVLGEAGLVFSEGDVAALADCLHRLIESPGLRRELAERGYERAMRCYTQERIAEQTVDLYRQLMTTEGHC
jgi:glycosyltransferase involved in cell wall biosynthesis